MEKSEREDSKNPIVSTITFINEDDKHYAVGTRTTYSTNSPKLRSTHMTN